MKIGRGHCGGRPKWLRWSLFRGPSGRLARLAGERAHFLSQDGVASARARLGASVASAPSCSAAAASFSGRCSWTSAGPSSACFWNRRSAFSRSIRYLLFTAALLSKQFELPPRACRRPGSESRCLSTALRTSSRPPVSAHYRSVHIVQCEFVEKTLLGGAQWPDPTRSS